MPQSVEEHLISREVLEFIISRKTRKLSPRTIQFYEDELNWFLQYLMPLQIVKTIDIQPTHIRQFLLKLGETRNEGGLHASWRAIKVYLRWWESEYAPGNGWRNPIYRVDAPKISKDPLPGVPIDNVRKMLATCQKTPLGARDRAIICFLADSGLRMTEFTDLTVEDVDIKTGAVIVQKGKGKKRRVVYIGDRAKKELLRYLRFREDISPTDPLWLTDEGTPLTPRGLREIIRRRAKKAGIKEPGLHDFRRLFCVESLRSGQDVFTLMRQTGHTTPGVLMRYLNLLEDDVKKAHDKHSPGDRL